MANQNQSLLTYAGRTTQLEEVYFAPVATISTTGVPVGTLYCCLSQVTPWSGNTVPTPTQDQKSVKQIFKNVFVAKKITTADISPVAQRIDWTANTTYQYYRDDIDMFETDQNGYVVQQFYVKNRYDQVFKCLWNGSVEGVPSTNEPYFQPGQYQTDNIFYGTDGYKWKYIYTIGTGLKNNFMDSNWIPVPVEAGTPMPNTVTADGFGSIDVINVINGGSGYDQSNSPISITVTGDGTGATAEVNGIVDGVIQDIIVLTPGSGYTYASVVISSATGSGATAIAPSSPVGGHGYDPVSELGCFNAMAVCSFDGDEETGGVSMIPTDITYYQMAVIVNPTTYSNFPYPATSPIYKTTTDVVVAAGIDTGFVSGEIVYQGTSLANATFSATCADFNQATNLVNLINIYGTPTYNASLFGNSSGSARTILTVNTPDFDLGSGYLMYIENLTGIQRSVDGIEQFKLILSY